MTAVPDRTSCRKDEARLPLLHTSVIVVMYDLEMSSEPGAIHLSLPLDRHRNAVGRRWERTHNLVATGVPASLR